MVQSGKACHDSISTLRGEGHRKDLAQAEAIQLLMSRLLCHVLEHLGFPEEPRIERRQSCPMILSLEQTLSMPLSFLLPQQEEVVDDYAEELPRGEQPVSVPDASPSVPPPTAPAPPETASPFSTSLQPSEHIPVTSRDLLAIMDALRTLYTTTASLAASQTALAKWMARAEVTLVQNQAILLQIQSHLGLPPVTVIEPIKSNTHDQSAVSASATSLDVLAAAAVASDPPVSTPPAE